MALEMGYKVASRFAKEAFAVPFVYLQLNALTSAARMTISVVAGVFIKFRDSLGLEKQGRELIEKIPSHLKEPFAGCTKRPGLDSVCKIVAYAAIGTAGMRLASHFSAGNPLFADKASDLLGSRAWTFLSSGFRA